MQSSLAYSQATISLKGTILRREENQSDFRNSDYCQSQRLLLYGDLTFRFERRLSASEATRGAANPLMRLSSQIDTGTWFVEARQGKAALVLKQYDNSELIWWYSESGESGIHYLNGQSWQHYLIS